MSHLSCLYSRCLVWFLALSNYQINIAESVDEFDGENGREESGEKKKLEEPSLLGFPRSSQ